MDETTNALVKIENLTYRPMGADHDILKEVNLQIEKGDFILLLGPSGFAGVWKIKACPAV